MQGDGHPVPIKARVFYAGVFLVCLSLMMLQIVETRLLSVVTHYHLAFFSISMSMFGMTAGAVWVYYQGARFTTATLPHDLTRLTSAFALSIAGCILVLVTQAPVLTLTFTTVIIWGELAIIMATPFFFAGAAVSLALTRSPFPVGRVYAADLIGASTGCLAVLPLLDWLDAPSAILGIGALAGIAAMVFRRAAILPGPQPGTLVQRLLARPAPVVIVLLGASILNGTTYHGLQPVIVKGKIENRVNLLFERWNSYSRVIAHRTPGGKPELPELWGPSDRLPRDLKVRQIALNIDGDAGTRMFRFDGDPGAADYLRYDVTNLAYVIRSSGRAAIIGVGGGRDVLSAWIFGHRDITGVELNPIFIDLLTERPPFNEFAGLADLPGVRFVVDDARSWFSRTSDRFDVIQMSMIDTWAATGAGAFSLSENGLYTIEGWRHFIDSLTPTGVFTVSRWYASSNVDETGRLMSLATRALLDLGVGDPTRHLFLISTKNPEARNLATLILARSPFTADEIAQLRLAAKELDFKVQLGPDQAPGSHVLKGIVSSESADDLQNFASRQALDLTPPTDDRPFFFNQLPLTRAYLALSGKFYKTTVGVLSGNIIASATLMTILLVSIVLVIGAIIVPLGPAIRQTGTALAVSGSAYFLLIGVGFMFIEIGLLQRLSTFLGHPIYSLSIVLFSTILFTGLGSLLSERRKLRTLPAFALWATMVCGYILTLPAWLPSVLNEVAGAGLIIRALLTVAIVAPAGLVMGFGFPTGMRLTMAHDTRPTPWFWGINGAGGVLGSVLAIACSITFGISVTLTVGGMCYLALIPVAYFLAMPVRRGEQGERAFPSDGGFGPRAASRSGHRRSAWPSAGG